MIDRDLGTVGWPTIGSLEAERRFAIDAVVAASRLTRAVRRDFDPSQAAAKADTSPVTVADLGAQALVSLALAETIPGDGLMGEEDSGPLTASPELADAVLARVREQRPAVTQADLLAALDRCADPGGPGRRWWTLDPVDGTKGFLRNEQYAVALALIEDGEVVLAVMACPNLPLAGGAAGPGPGRCARCGRRRPSAVSSSPSVAAGPSCCRSMTATSAGGGLAVRVAAPASASARSVRGVGRGRPFRPVGLRAHRPSSWASASEPLRLDSQTKYAVVARGDASIYLRLPRGGYQENVWDHAAGFLIVTEAGGRVSDVQGRPLDFTTGTRMTANSGIVATAASIHDEVVAAVRSVLEA